MDNATLDSIARALGYPDGSAVATIAGDVVTTADGVVHTFADPKRWGLADYVAPAPARPGKPAPETAPAA